jgi:hypothetical protein
VSSELVSNGSATAGRRLAAVVLGVLVAAGIGLLAGVLGDDGQFWTRAVVFAAATVGPSYGLAWLLLLSGSAGAEPVARPEDTVEQEWWQRSAAAAFLDVVTVAGVGTAALAVTGLEIAGTTALALLLVVALADVGTRLAVLRRRDA